MDTKQMSRSSATGRSSDDDLETEFLKTIANLKEELERAKMVNNVTGALIASYGLVSAYDTLQTLCPKRTEYASAHNEFVKQSVYFQTLLKDYNQKKKKTVTASQGFEEKKVESGKAGFAGVVGMASVKQELTSSFIEPLKYPTLYPAISPGVLLYGPPGTGKSYIVQALIEEAANALGGSTQLFFYEAKASDLKGKYVGETEKNIHALFEAVHRRVKDAKDKAPGAKAHGVIFIDEIDTLVPNRNREGAEKDEGGQSSLTQLLTDMDGVDSKKGVSVIGTTNHLNSIDAAFLRRLDAQIAVCLPSAADLAKLIQLRVAQHLLRPFYVDGDTVEASTRAVAQVRKEVTAVNVTTHYKNLLDSEAVHVPSVPEIDSKAAEMFTKNYSNSDADNAVSQWIQAETRVARSSGFKADTFSVGDKNISALIPDPKGTVYIPGSTTMTIKGVEMVLSEFDELQSRRPMCFAVYRRDTLVAEFYQGYGEVKQSDTTVMRKTRLCIGGKTYMLHNKYKEYREITGWTPKDGELFYEGVASYVSSGETIKKENPVVHTEKGKFIMNKMRIETFNIAKGTITNPGEFGCPKK